MTVSCSMTQVTGVLGKGNFYLRTHLKSEWLRSTKQMDVEKQEHLYIARGKTSWCNNYVNQCGSFSRSIRSNYTTFWTIHKGSTFCSNDTCWLVFIAALLTIDRKWKQPKWLSADEWILKMWCICTMEFYSAVKTDIIMKFIGKWM